MRRGWAAVAALAALSLLLAAAPDYDAWAYLTWGRELTRLELDTVDGPAFKPLPVAVCALLAPLGPDGWLFVVRAGALAALVLAAHLAWQLTGSRLSALTAAAGVALTGGFLRHAAVGDAEPLVVAFALGAFERHRAGRRGQALGLACAAALVRVETWPFVAAYALWSAHPHPRGQAPRHPRGQAPWLTPAFIWRSALGVAIVAAWLGPELAGSGELLRSGDRALVPNPGAPALADRPLLASLGDAVGLLAVPLVVLAARGPLSLLLAGAAWLVLVGLMAEIGFSGEARYALPGAAVLAVAAGAARAPRALVAVLLAATVVVSSSELRELPARLASGHELAADLRTAIERAGGSERLLACGRPAVGRFRGTLLAYALDVPKRFVRADGRPDAVTFRSRLLGEDALSPGPGGPLLSAVGRWRIESDCVAGRRTPPR